MTKLTYSGRLFVCPKPQTFEKGVEVPQHTTVAVVTSVQEEVQSLNQPQT